MQNLEDKLRLLTTEDRQKVDIFIGLLLEKHRPHEAEAPRLDWAGTLKDLRDSYSSVELQHAISTWRSSTP